MRVLFVGQNPGKTPFRRSPTLARINHWLDEAGIRYYSLVNVGHQSGDDYETDPGFLREVCDSGFDRIISLGRVADSHLRRLNVDHLALPHPSPRNRMWNDPQTERRCVSLCQEYLRDGEALRLLDAG